MSNRPCYYKEIDAEYNMVALDPIVSAYFFQGEYGAYTINKGLDFKDASGKTITECTDR